MYPTFWQVNPVARKVYRTIYLEPDQNNDASLVLRRALYAGCMVNMMVFTWISALNLLIGPALTNFYLMFMLGMGLGVGAYLLPVINPNFWKFLSAACVLCWVPMVMHAVYLQRKHWYSLCNSLATLVSKSDTIGAVGDELQFEFIPELWNCFDLSAENIKSSSLPEGFKWEVDGQSIYLTGALSIDKLIV